MLWLIPVILSFDIIEALVPVIIILVLIAAAAGLTRGTDIFALFGLGTIMGFANAGSSRVGKGLKGTRYGADAIKRRRAAGKANGGLVNGAANLRKDYKAAKMKATVAKAQNRIGSARRVSKQLKELKAKGMGKSYKAKNLQAKLDKIKEANLRDYNAKKMADQVIKTKGDSNAKAQKIIDYPRTKMAATLPGGLVLSAASAAKINKKLGKKGISGRASILNSQLEEQKKKVSAMQQRHMNKTTIYKKNDITDFSKIPKETRYVSASREGIRIGHVPKSNNYVKTINSKSGEKVNVLKIPKSAFAQTGATTALAMSMLQRHWSKQIEKGGKHAARAERRLGKLNDIVAKMHYGTSSSRKAFEAAASGELRSKNAKKLNNAVSFSLPLPGGGLVGSLIGRRYNEVKLKRLPHEDYWGVYRTRRRDYDKIMREMYASKDHTLRHPIAGRHGVASIEEKQRELWKKAYLKALKNMKKASLEDLKNKK